MCWINKKEPWIESFLREMVNRFGSIENSDLWLEPGVSALPSQKGPRFFVYWMQGETNPFSICTVL